MAKALTAAAVARLKPTAARQEIRDGGCRGLHLVIQPSGVKSWILRTRRPDGRTTKITLGRADPTEAQVLEPTIGMPLTLAGARLLATRLHQQKALGVDIARRQAPGLTFAQAAKEFVEQHSMVKVRSWKTQARLLGVHTDLTLIRGGIADRWSDRSVTEIDGDAIHDLMEEVRESGVPGLRVRVGRSETRATGMFMALSMLFSWLLSKRRVKVHPCTGIGVATSKSRDRVLTDAEVRDLWRASEGAGDFGIVVRLLLLTGSRRSEVGGIRRSEISEDGATWTIPGSRTKNHRPHVVPLSPQAREIIASLPTEDPMIHVGSWSRAKRELGHALQQPWRIHDLRRTAATGMASIGVQPHIVEAVLNHVSGAKAGVAGIYNRHSYQAEKAAALQQWADHVLALADGNSNVVPLRRA